LPLLHVKLFESGEIVTRCNLALSARDVTVFFFWGGAALAFCLKEAPRAAEGLVDQVSQMPVEITEIKAE
jgi:hypothetical protein